MVFANSGTLTLPAEQNYLDQSLKVCFYVGV